MAPLLEVMASAALIGYPAARERYRQLAVFSPFTCDAAKWLIREATGKGDGGPRPAPDADLSELACRVLGWLDNPAFDEAWAVRSIELLFADDAARMLRGVLVWIADGLAHGRGAGWAAQQLRWTLDELNRIEPARKAVAAA